MTDSPSSSPSSLHYRLTNEEWVKAVHELTPAQRDVLYYIRTLDPFGDRYLDLGVREIAGVLKCDPSTVSRALKALDSKGYIDLDLIRVGIRIRSCGKGDAAEASEKVLSSDNGVASEQQCCAETTVLPQNNKVDRHATKLIATQQTRSPRNTRASETASSKDSGTPHTIQTIQTYTNSLSASEREKFLAFARGKVNDLPTKPTLPDTWIAAHYQELWQQYQQKCSGGAASDTIDWEQHPQREAYLSALRSQGMGWIGTCYGDPEEKARRMSFWQWAKATGLVRR